MISEIQLTEASRRRLVALKRESDAALALYREHLHGIVATIVDPASIPDSSIDFDGTKLIITENGTGPAQS